MRSVFRKEEFTTLLEYIAHPELFTPDEPDLTESIERATYILKKEQPWRRPSFEEVWLLSEELQAEYMQLYGHDQRNSPARWGSPQEVRTLLCERVLASPLLWQWYEQHLLYSADVQRNLLTGVCHKLSIPLATLPTARSLDHVYLQLL
jgi:hypothetical protein